MDNGKCIMDNDCIAFGDDFKLFPKEIPQLSIINYPFARQCDKRKFEQQTKMHRFGGACLSVVQISVCALARKWIIDNG